jgi:hypothetical protein
VVSVLDPTVDQAADWTLAVLGTLATQISALVSLGRLSTGAADSSRLETLGREVLAAVEAYGARE